MERNPFKELQELGDAQSVSEDHLESSSITKEPEKVSEIVQVIPATPLNDSDSDFTLLFDKENRSDIKGSRNRHTKSRSSILKSFDPLYVASPVVLNPVTEGQQITPGFSTGDSANNLFTKLLDLTQNDSNSEEIKNCSDNLQVVNIPSNDDSFIQLLGISENTSKPEDIEVTSEHESSSQQENEVLVNSSDSANEDTKDIENLQESVVSSESVSILGETISPNNTTTESEKHSELLKETVVLSEKRAESPNKATELDISKNITLEQHQTQGSDECAVQVENRDVSTETSMADEQEKLLLEQIAELKLQLDAAQQANADLEQKIRAKEELDSKSRVDDSNKEVKDLKEKLEKINAEKTKLSHVVDTFKKDLEEWNATMTTKDEELKKLKEENSIATRHLANLELAFRDVLEKYDRCKGIIEGYKCNEETLRQNLARLEDKLHKNEEKYDALKAHAKAQLERSNKEIIQTRDTYEAEITKLTTIIKRQDIKNKSLVEALDQKIKECSSMAALFDEMTGKI